MRRLCVLVLCMVGASLFAQSKPTVKIGVVFPLTGNNAYMGEMGRAGIEMRLRELTKENKFRYQIIYEDDGFVFSKTALAVKKFKDIDKVDVVISMWGYGSDIALPQLKDAKILHVNVDRWTAGSGERDFACGSSLDLNIQQFVKLAKAMGYKRVAYIGTYDQGAEAYRKQLAEELPKHGIQLVESVAFPIDVRDLRTWILKTADLKPDIVIDCAAMPVCQIFSKQNKELGSPLRVGNISAATYEIDADLREGTWLILPSLPKPEWSQKFKTRFKKDGNYPAPQFYNTISMVIEAYERWDGKLKPTADEVAGVIRGMKSFEGATGTLSWAPPGRFEAPVSYFVFKNGVAETVSLQELLQFCGRARQD